MFKVEAKFIGNFKLGDNINYNLEILRYIYGLNDNNSCLLRKPIILILGGIAEAILHDLHQRMKLHTVEGVIGIGNYILSYVRLKQIDKFEQYIASARKHTLLGPSTDQIYGDLDNLRKLRNRIHIQNEKNHFEVDDSQAFSLERQQNAERTVEKLTKIISANHPRKLHARGFVGDFEFPWGEYFT